MAEEERKRERVLVVGGSGYLGQHLLAALALAADRLDVAFTHHSQAPPQPLLDALPSVRAFRADLRSGDGLEAISASFGQVRVCIPTAAPAVASISGLVRVPPTFSRTTRTWSTTTSEHRVPFRHTLPGNIRLRWLEQPPAFACRTGSFASACACALV
jgi:hypothetical protein